MEFLVGVGLLLGSIYLFTSGSPAFGGVLLGVGVVAVGGGLFRRGQRSASPESGPPKS